MVQPGTYMENINFNGKNIVVGSMFIINSDTSYISQTLIDGGSNGSVVIFENGEVSEAIARNLLNTISGEDKKRVKENRPINLEAWEYYSKGKYYNEKFIRHTRTIEYFTKSEEMLKKAIELDPDYVSSYAILADLYNTYFNYVATGDEEKQKNLDLQEEYISTGFKIDLKSADLFWANGLYLNAKGDLSGEYESYKEAIRLETYNEMANFNMGSFLMVRGLHDLAIKYHNLSIEINPLYPYSYQHRSVSYTAIGNHIQANMDILKALEIDSNMVTPLWMCALDLIITNRFDEAKVILKKIDNLVSDDQLLVKLAKSITFALNGKKEKAFEIFPNGHWWIFYVLKMPDEFIDEIIRRTENSKNSESSLYLMLCNGREFDFLHDDPRFQEILEKEKKLYDELLEKYPDIDI